MLAFAFLALSFILGLILIKTFLPHTQRSLFFFLPAGLITGLICSTWLTYFAAFACMKTGHGTAYGTAVTLNVLSLIIIAYYLLRRPKLHLSTLLRPLFQDFCTHLPATIVLFAVTIFTTWVMFHTFSLRGPLILMGHNVFSDFGAHLALVRSFSVGNNFPTQYPHFPDGTIRYHFMFQFLVAILETTGLRLDLAFNLPSILAIVCCAALLYEFAYRLTRHRGASAVAIILMFFRPSIAGLTYLAQHSPFHSLSEVITLITSTQTFIGHTPRDEWGLWASVNIFVNQRHLLFALAILFMTLIVVLPYVTQMSQVISRPHQHFLARLRHWLFTPDAWLPAELSPPIFLGILVGLLGFFNGAVTISILAILAVLAIFSKHRLSFAIIAAIGTVLVMLEGQFFAPGVSLAVPRLQFGFIVDQPSWPNILLYLFTLTGALFFLVLAAVVLQPKKFAVPALAFLAPLLITFTLSLTPDVTVNHKYLLIAMILFNILAAFSLFALFNYRGGYKLLNKILASALFLLLIITGVFDHAVTFYKNDSNHRVLAHTTDAVQTWIKANTQPNDIFASYIDWLNPVLLSGRPIFMGWPYFAWSAGHDTVARGEILQEIFSTTDSARLRQLALENNLDYLIVDEGLRSNREFITSDEFIFNETTIHRTFPLVLNDPASKTLIYAVHEPSQASLSTAPFLPNPN